VGYKKVRKNMNKKFGLIILFSIGLILPFTMLVANAATEPDFGGASQFRARWLAQDKLVGTSGIKRPYTWGPNIPGAPTTLSEAYADSPGGSRRVLYLDKARMEMNDPGTGFVTTGLAVKELVSGMRQDGNNTFVSLKPSQTQVAGDPVSVNPDAPVYASFKNVVTLGNADANSKPNAAGQIINSFIAKNGAISTITPPLALTVGAYQSQTGHNVAKPFLDFENQVGPVTDPATGNTIQNQPIYTTDPTSNVFGLAISEPYWVTTKIAGLNQTVLVQLFERRVLTYNPALAENPVEMGNVGQHYYQWRYVESVTTPPTATPTPTTRPTATPTPTTSPATFANFNGNWNTNFALLGLSQTGNQVTGFYRRYGEVTNIQIVGTVTGYTLNGYYLNNPSLTFALVLSQDGYTFTGYLFGTNQWCGARSGNALPSGCGFSRSWSTNFAQVNLTQTGNSVYGTYRRYDLSYDQAINGTVTGSGNIPQLDGYYGGVQSQTLEFILNPLGNTFDGHYGANNQWCGVSVGSLPAGCGWSGKWNLSQVGTVANLVQTGSYVAGTYVNTNTGTLSGNITGYIYTLAGTWSINGRSGPFRWTMTDKGSIPQRFQGNYNSTIAWCGYRDGTTAPNPCFFN
jgi:hypothetical protein